MLTYNKVLGVPTKHLNYSQCSVCGKNVYTRSALVNPKGGGRKKVVDKDEYSDYNLPYYSLFTKDGRIITQDMLTLEADGTTERRFSAQDSLSGGSVEYSDAKTWAEISNLISSGSKSEHMEGVARRSEALRQLGARRIIKNNAPVSDSKYLCPYLNKGDRSKSLASFTDQQDKEELLKIKDFECGIYIDPEPIIASRGSISPESLQAIRPPLEGSSREIFEAKLDAAIESGELDPSVKDRFISELKRRSGGGWKFSNKFFNCPTKIDIPDEHRNERELKRQRYLSKYSYIASPISGPVSSDSITFKEDGGIDINATSVYPPVAEDGRLSSPADGTMTYLVCGEKTSLSSFSRSPDSEDSLPNILKKLMSEAKSDSNLSYKVQSLIETLISLGVDLSDILPFIEDPASDDPTSPQLRGIESIVGDINSVMSGPNPDTLAQLEEHERLNKIAGLLAVAMATPVNLGNRVRGTSLSRMDLLGDIKLVCNHGHTFSIKDSVYFGRTHTGINLRNTSKSAYSKNAIIASGILLEDGKANFEATLGLTDSSGRRYMQVTSESDLIGIDSSRKYRYDEWRGASNDIKRTMFKGVDDLHYGFSSTPRTFLWGSEEGNELSSARERESADSATRIYLESSEMLSVGGHKDADGKLISFDAEQKAAYDEWKRSETEGGSSGSSSGVSSMMAERGEESYIEVRSTIGKLLRSFLLSMQGWLKLATTLDIHASLAGRPDAINIEDDEDNSFGSILRGNSRRAIEAIVRSVEEEHDDELSGESEALIEQSFSYFDEKYLSQLQELDRKMLHIISETLREFLVVGMVNSILRSISNIYGEDAHLVTISFKSELMQGGGVAYASLYEKGRDGGPTAGALIGEIVEHLSPAALSEKERARVLSDPLAVGKGSEWYGAGAPSKEGVSGKIAKMKGKEYMGRVLEGASALYIAEVISNSYNLYMRDSGSSSYIGYDIGVDLSTLEKVLALTHDDLRNIIIGLEPGDEFDEEEGKERAKVEGDSTALTERHEDRLEFYDRYLGNITKCKEGLEASIFALRTACTSSKYMSKSTEYITGFLSEMIDEVGEAESPEAVRRARLIIDNVMTNSPFTTISLNSDGKYRKHFGGSGAVDTEALIPSFGSVLMRLNSDKQEAIYPIYKLSDNKGIYHSFDIEIEKSSGYRECYVLSKEDLPNSTESFELNETLPNTYRKNGWRIFLVITGKEPGEYSDLAGTTGTASSNKGWREGVSLIYHPATLSILGEDEEVLGYRNDDLGLNSTETMFVGPLSVRRGGQLSFPPNPYNQSNVGIPIPIDYKGVSTTDSTPVFPIIGTRIPVEINSSESVAPVSVDISDFLQRDPPELALNILLRIEKLYANYQEEIKSVIVSGASGIDQGAIKERYRGAISSLHSTYRGLPINVASGNISTEKARSSIGIHSDLEGRAESFRPKSSLYMPLIDWVTMSRMLSSEAFGPEWGGHQIWSAEEADDEIKNRRREALEELSIKTNSLDILATQIGLKLDEKRRVPKGTTSIDPRDLLDPVGRLIGNSVITEAEADAVFGPTVMAALTNVGETGLAWVGVEGLNEGNIQGSMLSRFPQWAKGTGSFYSIGSAPREDEVSEDPFAYIKLMNVVFPSNKAGSKGDSARERLDRARDPNNSDILSTDLCYSHEIISGSGTKPVYYPLPKDEKDLRKYRKDLKGVRHISVRRYAEAISEYLADFVRRDLLPFWEQGAGQDESLDKESVSSFGLVKFSEKRDANMYYGGIINDEGLLALWNLINR